MRVHLAEGGRLWSLAWAALLVLLVTVNTATIPVLYLQLSTPPADVLAALATSGISVQAYAAYMTTMQAVFGLVCIASAATIWWQLPRQVFPRFVAALLVLSTVASPPNLGALVTNFPSIEPLARAAEVLFWGALLAFPFLFPNGTFVPKWTRLPVLAIISAIAISSFVLNGSLTDPPDPIGPLMLVGLVGGLAAFVYRYARRSDAVQRQQTKWVFAAGAVVIVVSVLDVVVLPLVPQPVPPELRSTPFDPISTTLMSCAYALLPVSVAVAILRFRLWDIDAFINRALVYGILSAVLLALYAAVVTTVGALARGADSGFAPLIATLLVALCIRPFHARTQKVVTRLLYGDRDDPYVALGRLGQQLESTLTPDAVLPAIVHGITDALRVPHVALEVHGTNGLVLNAASGRVVTEPRLRLPVSFQNQTLGELTVSARTPGERFSTGDRRLLEDLARQAGVAAHAALLAAELELSRVRLVVARENARRQLGSDLHDGLGHRLAGLLRATERAANLIENHPVEAREVLSDVGRQTRSAIHDVRQLAHQLHPPELDLLGLVGALREQADRHTTPTGLRVSVAAAPDLPKLPAAVEVAAYLVVCEALTNVERHANASQCCLRLALIEPDSDTAARFSGARRILLLEVIDDGQGATNMITAGLGLTSMRERATELGGSFSITTVQPHGTHLAVHLPCLEIE